MTENIPIITVTCYRDLPMLELQAQSICQYLDINTPVYIIVNEDNYQDWLTYFDSNLRHYYSNHRLTILLKKDFVGEWEQWIPSNVNPWAVGWETQQVLKLAVATHLKSNAFLICDSQNFLIKPWDPNKYNLHDNKIPYRIGNFVMPLEIWKDYSQSLKIEIGPPDDQTISMCTPIFMHTGLVQDLIESTGGIKDFSKWFKNASRIKSEFILYSLWVEKNGGVEKFHDQVDDWANPYLRDCRTEEEFSVFLHFIGKYDPHAWISINHRAWGNMTRRQYIKLRELLKKYNLVPNFEEYRSSYIDIKI